MLNRFISYVCGIPPFLYLMVYVFVLAYVVYLFDYFTHKHLLSQIAHYYHTPAEQSLTQTTDITQQCKQIVHLPLI